MADDTGERAVEARMRHALPDDPVIGDAIAVGADQRLRRADDRADVVLRDRGDQHAGRTVVGDQVIAELLDRIDAALGGGGRGCSAGGLRPVRWEADPYT